MLRGFLKSFAPGAAAIKVKKSLDGRLHLLEGRRGRGKSYNTVDWIYLAAVQRTPVRANFQINLHNLALRLTMRKAFPSLAEAYAWSHDNIKVITTWDQLFESHGCLFVLDELSRMMDSRNRGSAPDIAREFFQQCRKLRMTGLLISQSSDWLDVRLRQLIDVIWQTRIVYDRSRGQKVPREFILYGFDPFALGLHAGDISRNAEWVMNVPFDLSLARIYNTYERIVLFDSYSRYKSIAEISYPDGIRRALAADYVPPHHTFRDLESLLPPLERHHQSAGLGRHADLAPFELDFSLAAD